MVSLFLVALFPFFLPYDCVILFIVNTVSLLIYALHEQSVIFF